MSEEQKTETDAPTIIVRAGQPSEIELAALVVVLAEATANTPHHSSPPTDRWSDVRRQFSRRRFSERGVARWARSVDPLRARPN
jgi:hypothetical protein